MMRAHGCLQVVHDLYGQFETQRDEWEKRHRAKVMYWTNWNYAPLITRTPIKSLDDIKGKRIRGYGVATDVIERLGGTAVPMAAPEVYTAMERGVLDRKSVVLGKGVSVCFDLGCRLIIKKTKT